MSSGGSSGGTGYSTQQSKSSNEPPEFIQPYLKGGIEDLVNLRSTNPNAPDYFPGSTVAPQSAATQQAIQMLMQRGANGAPVTGAAETNLTDTLNGKYLDPTSSPDYMRAIAASHQPYLDQFTNQVIPGITSAFEGSGRTGSGLHQAAVDQATTSLNRTISDSDAKAGADYFTNARAQQLQAAGLAPQLAQSDYTDIGAVGQAGDITDAFNQSKVNEDITRYNYNNNKQWDYLSRYLGILNGAYPGGTTNSTSSGTQQMPGGSSSPWGSIMGGASLALQAAPMLMAFSDERLKEDISAPIGATHDGIPIRLWRYKDDPEPRVGFIAQEVAQHRPDAVHDHSSGFKMVDYRAATEQRGLF